MDIRNFFSASSKKKIPAIASTSVDSSRFATPTSDNQSNTHSQDYSISMKSAEKLGDSKGASSKLKDSGQRVALSLEERRRRIIESDDDSDSENAVVIASGKLIEKAPSSSTRTSPRKRKVPSPCYHEEKTVDVDERNVKGNEKKINPENSKRNHTGAVSISKGSKIKTRRNKVREGLEDETYFDDLPDAEKSDDGGGDEDYQFDSPGDSDSDTKDSDTFDEVPKKTKPKGRKYESIGTARRSASKKELLSTNQSPPKPKAASKTLKNVEKKIEIPKYHPPSSILMTEIPFLIKDISMSIQSSLPKLPLEKNSSLSDAFSINLMTPLCLEGLTFVFSGVLTTNDSHTVITNNAVAMSSPSRGDYYHNRNAYTTSITAGVGSDEELARDLATDLIKILGGRVTTAVSSKTDYLIVGSILEDGRQVEDGSKYRKVLEIWKSWREKNKGQYATSNDDEINEPMKTGNKNKRKTVTKKVQDPNSLVEIIRGIHEFYGLLVFYSDWKKRISPEEEEPQSELKQSVKKEIEDKEPSEAINTTSASLQSTVPVVINPYAKKSGNAHVAPVNPYSRKASNTYVKSSFDDNDGAIPSKTSSSPNRKQVPVEKTSGLIHSNALWSDKYTPASSKEILGNGDSVAKLFNWLEKWENQFNKPDQKVKSLSGPNGPWKAALLSGPPGIGKTTTANLVARESNRVVLELNASDARSKKALNEALGDVTGSQVLCFETSHKSKSKPRKRCIIMDEVDGMGAGDRSGISELIQMIKQSKVPIICICNDRSSQKMKSLVQYCMDLRFRRPTKSIIAKRAVEIGRKEGMLVEINAAEAMSESCGNDIRQVLNCLQMWSCKKSETGNSATMTYRNLIERQNDINKDEVLRVSMFDATKLIVEGSRGLAGADSKAITASLMRRSDAFFVDYMLMGLNIHQNYLKVSLGHFNNAKIKGDESTELQALNQMYDAALAMSDFGVCEEQLRGGDQNWALLPLCAILGVKVGFHAGGPNGGILPGYPEFAGWLGKNSSRNKMIRLLQELMHHMNFKVSASGTELRMSYLPVMRQQFQALLFGRGGPMVNEAIELMDEYGLDRDDVFESLDEFHLAVPDSKEKKLGEIDSKAKAAFTRAYNQVAHKAPALVAEQGGGKSRHKKSTLDAEVNVGGELDIVDDDKEVMEDVDENELEENMEELLGMFKREKSKKAVGGGTRRRKK